jgi:ubiquinone/menaquinone biosynthesis C-methylase UbiE
MFARSAAFYDALYAWKDYAGEVRRLHALISQHKRSAGRALLDVACGTGNHISFLREHYTVEGLDLDPTLLATARQKYPDIVLHHADMIDFDLGRRFDVVVCLFSSIGYVKTLPALRQALQTMTRHLDAGGLLIIEPWLTPEVYQVGSLHALFVDRPALKIARMNVSAVEDGASVFDFHYLVGTPGGIEHFTERHKLCLFTHDEYLEAMRGCGLEVLYDREGLMGRGLYIGIRPVGD